MKKKGKAGKEKGEKRLKNTSLRIKNSKIYPPGASEKKMIEMYNIKYPVQR